MTTRQQAINDILGSLSADQMAVEIIKLRAAAEIWRRRALSPLCGGIDDPRHQMFDVLAMHPGTRELIIYTVEAANKIQAFDKAAVEAGDLVNEVDFVSCVPAGLLYCPSDKPVVAAYFIC